MIKSWSSPEDLWSKIATISMALGKLFNPSLFIFLIYEMSGSQIFGFHRSVQFLKGVAMKQQRVANIILPSVDIQRNKWIKNYHLVPSLHKTKDI